MIFIKKNQVNRIVLTLTESSRIFNAFYLFEFTNEYNLNSQPIYFTTPNKSNNINRYDLFHITESSSGSTTGGEDVPLSLASGQYKYNIYESSASTLNLSATTQQIIESGRMIVDMDNEASTDIINDTYL